MIYFISIGILVISLILLKFYDKFCWSDSIQCLILTITIIFAFMIGIMTFVAIGAVVSNEATAASYNTQYESYTTQIKFSYYQNDNNLGSSALYENITTYNQEVSSHKAYRNSIWTFIFYEKCYEDMPLIEIPILNN